MRARDTSRAAEAVQRYVVGRMTFEQRFDKVVELAETSRELARVGIRRRHPEYSATEVEYALLRLLLGDELYERAWPDRPLLDR